MTTTPETSTIIKTIQKDWSWLLSHLILLIFVGALVTGAVYGVNSIIARHDAAQTVKYSAVLAAQTAQTQTLLKQMNEDRMEAQLRDEQYQAIISQLSKSIQMRDSRAQKQQQADAALNVVSAASRLATQTDAKTGEITVANDDITLDLPITRRIISGLDELSVAQVDLQDTKNQLVAQTGLTADANMQLTNATKVIASQTIQLTDSTKVCAAQMKSLKANYRKKLIKVGVISYVAGFISGVAAHLFIK